MPIQLTAYMYVLWYIREYVTINTVLHNECWREGMKEVVPPPHTHIYTYSTFHLYMPLCTLCMLASGQRYRRRLTAQQRDEKRQNIRRQLVRQHLLFADL